MALLTMNFESYYLANNFNVNIILPDRPTPVKPTDYYKADKKYKVLWLLHGTYGDYSDWIRKSLIELYAAERELIVVMPSACNSSYGNWPNFGIGFDSWNYILEELMPMIYSWFPASDKPEDNYVAGLSMGGRGTTKLICAHPEKFAGAAVLSSAPKNYRKLIEEGKINPRMASEIKAAGSKAKFLKSPENTWDGMKKLAKMENAPKLYFACGEDDFLYNIFTDFRSYAKEIGLKAEFVTEAGYTHEWRFWDKYIELALDYLGIEKVKK